MFETDRTVLWGVPDLDKILVLGILLFFCLVEVVFGYLQNSKRKSGDWIIEIGNFALLSGLTKPGIVALVWLLGGTLLPEAQNLLSSLSIWITLPLYLLVDDLLQYWYHRSAHEYPFLWKLHRPHHQAEEMGFFVSYRNAALYYLMMPNIWWMALFTFCGGATAVAIGLILKQLVIIGSHSTTKWDRFLYKIPVLATIVERIIITPAFHFAHHGKSKADGISDPNGNFGNMFSFWDQIFGTALFTRKYPEAFGLQKHFDDHWTASWFFPFVRSKDKESEISADYKKSDTRRMEPTVVELEAGNYLYCTCGMSREQPFCDGSHHGSKHKPLLLNLDKKKKLKLCNCKLSQHAPYCDNSHA